MRTFDVPGIALAIVTDDAVVLAKGYGVGKLGDATPVDARTLFGIASNTKAFTATAVGLLVEEGKVEWDAYAYDNMLYLVAGELIEAVSGQSWEEFVTSRILAKVGMSGSNVRHSAAAANGNIATPHAPIDGRVRPIAPFDSDNTNPAGGINSSADDMAKWLRVHLSGGRLADGGRLFSAATARELTGIVTPLRVADPPPELPPLKNDFRGYALGFDIRDYRGRKAVMHTGGRPGYVSRLIMIPDASLGVAVLTNPGIH